MKQIESMMNFKDNLSRKEFKLIRKKNIWTKRSNSSLYLSYPKSLLHYWTFSEFKFRFFSWIFTFFDEKVSIIEPQNGHLWDDCIAPSRPKSCQSNIIITFLFIKPPGVITMGEPKFDLYKHMKKRKLDSDQFGMEDDDENLSTVMVEKQSFFFTLKNNS